MNPFGDEFSIDAAIMLMHGRLEKRTNQLNKDCIGAFENFLDKVIDLKPTKVPSSRNAYLQALFRLSDQHALLLKKFSKIQRVLRKQARDQSLWCVHMMLHHGKRGSDFVQEMQTDVLYLFGLRKQVRLAYHVASFSLVLYQRILQELFTGQPPSYGNLPSEIIAMIFSHLNYKDCFAMLCIGFPEAEYWIRTKQQYR